MPLWLLIVAELACVAAVVAGVAMIWLPAAVILAGILGVVACERWSPVLAARAGRGASAFPRSGDGR